jgi:hypothetical protein
MPLSLALCRHMSRRTKRKRRAPLRYKDQVWESDDEEDATSLSSASSSHSPSPPSRKKSRVTPRSRTAQSKSARITKAQQEAIADWWDSPAQEGYRAEANQRITLPRSLLAVAPGLTPDQLRRELKKLRDLHASTFLRENRISSNLVCVRCAGCTLAGHLRACPCGSGL